MITFVNRAKHACSKHIEEKNVYVVYRSQSCSCPSVPIHIHSIHVGIVTVVKEIPGANSSVETPRFHNQGPLTAIPYQSLPVI